MKLFYRALGETGTPVIILHGIFGTSDNWLGFGKAISENHRVFLVDQRNHGQSPWSDEFDYQVMSEDLKEFIDTHQLTNPIIIGSYIIVYTSTPIEFTTHIGINIKYRTLP